MAIDCQHGFHAPAIEGEPVEHGGCVNVEYSCPVCSEPIYVVSWSQAAWLEHQIKELARMRQARSKTRDKQPRPSDG